MDWFAKQLLKWSDQHGRHDLPWQQNICAYRVWVSEIMLQQTQVATVIPYFERFVLQFPDVTQLANAHIDEVLHLWTGLGYYARARNLHKAAIRTVNEYGSELPKNLDQLVSLPGIGRSTAGAILAIAYGEPASILDGNVKRVLTRFHAVSGFPGLSAITQQLWLISESHTPQSRLPEYTQAIMDLGATLCTRKSPNCASCPIGRRCKALEQGQVEKYPEARPKKIKPVRQCRMFLIEDSSGALFLEQRPAEGIWGGLWSPPQRDHDYSAEQVLDELNLAIASEHSLHTPFRHTFTHFHLDIEPVHILLRQDNYRIRSNLNHIWYRQGQKQKLGLSSVAVKLLASALKERTIEKS